RRAGLEGDGGERLGGLGAGGEERQVHAVKGPRAEFLDGVGVAFERNGRARGTSRSKEAEGADREAALLEDREALAADRAGGADQGDGGECGHGYGGEES